MLVLVWFPITSLARCEISETKCVHNCSKLCSKARCVLCCGMYWSGFRLEFLNIINFQFNCQCNYCQCTALAWHSFCRSRFELLMMHCRAKQSQWHCRLPRGFVLVFVLVIV